MKLKVLVTSLLLLVTVSNAETVTTNVVNVPLQESSTSSRILDLIPANTAVEKSGEQNLFYNVKYNNMSGWIAKKYTVEGEKSTVPDITPGSVSTVTMTSIVKTDLPNALPKVNETQLTKMISTYYTGARRNNLLSLVSSFVKMQETYNVNAVFAVAASVIESGGGTSGKLINSLHSYNLFSIKGTNGGKYVSFNGASWKKYSSFAEAVMDFGNLIANGKHYFTQGKYTPISIGKTYCNEQWGINVAKQMKGLYNSL